MLCGPPQTFCELLLSIASKQKAITWSSAGYEAKTRRTTTYVIYQYLMCLCLATDFGFYEVSLKRNKRKRNKIFHWNKISKIHSSTRTELKNPYAVNRLSMFRHGRLNLLIKWNSLALLYLFSSGGSVPVALQS